MTRLMFDSTNMDAIPADAKIVAGYPHAFPTDYGRFPNALQVRIDQHGNHADDCHVADVENGAISISTVRQWVESWHLLHPNGLAAVNGFFDQPTVYSSESNMKATMGALVGLSYDFWVASWDIGPTVIPGTNLHQYASPTSNPPSGGDYDLSVVYDDTWGVRPLPVSPAWIVQAVADTKALLALLESHL